MNDIIARPAMDIQTAADQYNTFAQFVQTIMKKDLDYGIIPGTGSKPSLYKPGAEKLINFFSFSVEMKLINKIEDWTGAAHGGEPFFFYHYQARLLRNGILVAEEEGSCNSWEKKYRYRKGDRTCPECGQVGTIIKGKKEFGGGWLCWKNKGGCNAKWKEGDPQIEGQNVENVPNPEIFDQVNTIQKMAQKRALVAVALVGCRASDFFTQDVEDLVYDAPSYTVQEATYEEVPPTSQNLPLATRGETKQPAQYKHLKKDGMDTQTLVRTATSYQREKAEQLAELRGYIFTRPLNEYNEIEMRHIIEFFDDKREYHRVSAFIQKTDLTERVAQPEEEEPAQEYRASLVEIFVGQVKKIHDLNVEPNEHLTKCLSLDPETCPEHHLEGAIQYLKNTIEYAEQQLKQEQQAPKTIGEWARSMKDTVLDVQTWGTGMISEFFTQAVLHSKEHTSLKNMVPFDIKEVEGLTPNGIYQRIMTEAGPERPEQILREARRLNLQVKQAKSNTPVKRG